ncbi:MAG: hypothetical protein JNM59_12780 [Hyphomonadaceae bacterium]|nr:hypothetical protein [Hyphomonadaceae bacterium]
MRPGVIVSLIGHAGAVMLTMLAWEARSTLPVQGAAIVPVEIVDLGAEANVRALAEQVADDEVAPQEEEQLPEEPAAAPSPTPQPRRPQTNDDDFNLADISGMIDRQRNRGRRQQEGAPADRNQRGAGLGTEERATVESRVASLMDRALRRCWRSTADMPDPERLIVVVEVQLDRNGRLVGQPRVVSPVNYTFDPLMNEAVNRALRAVRVCDPYEFLPNDPSVGEYFEVWRTQEVRFGLRQSQ